MRHMIVFLHLNLYIGRSIRLPMQIEERTPRGHPHSRTQTVNYHHAHYSALFSIILYCRILITLILATPRRRHFCVSPRLSVIAGCHKRIDDRMSELTNLHFGQAKRTGDKVCTAFDCLFYVLEMDRSQARGPSAEPVTPKCALSIYSCFRSCSRLAMVCEGLSLLLHSASRGL